MGEQKGDRVLIGFAAESHDLIEAARDKLEHKNLDLIVANDITSEGLGFGSAHNRVSLVSGSGVEDLPVMTKRALAREICDRLAALARRRSLKTTNERKTDDAFGENEEALCVHR
jgi:phosphopantothenoylcysteine decarboxylase / phosphopantothenate---cysteine ligase